MKIYKKDPRLFHPNGSSSTHNNTKYKIPIKFVIIGFFFFIFFIYISTLSFIINKKHNEDHSMILNEHLNNVNDGSDKSGSSASTSASSASVSGSIALDSNTVDIKSDSKPIVQNEPPKTTTTIDYQNAAPQLDKVETKEEVVINQPAISTQQLTTTTKTTPQLKAYIEQIDQSQWSIKPLPIRQTQAKDLVERSYPDLTSCTKLPEQFPVDEDDAPTNQDPFLPWIHDVFPTADGKYIQFIAQNKRRCQTGTRKTKIKKFMQPNVAIFQHVPIQRVDVDDGGDGDKTTRYKLTSHEEADPDGIETRFICRFKPSNIETLSVFNFNYDFHTLRKAYRATFTEEGFDNHMIWSSQLLFKCPVPPELQEDVKSGKTVVNDYATLFVDLIPIRTPPRYGPPTTYLPPRLFAERNTWNVKKEWGMNHILPKIEDSGRWENIPICKPSLMTYPDEKGGEGEEEDGSNQASSSSFNHKEHDEKMLALANSGKKKHELISCSWTSAAFKTRGGRTSVSDGQERLLQWLEYNKLVGIDHVYIYDNSGAFSSEPNLKPITDKFPGFVTRINWPAKVCNNNRGNTDNKGERSSQYAADASCRLRFGSHSTWLASVDTDEYLVPMEKYNNLRELLEVVDKEDVRVLNFYSKRSKARLRYLNTTSAYDKSCSMQDTCFDPSLPQNKTFLEVYNCNNERPPRKDVQPAEKAIYKPDYVLQFFVHYATVTALSATGKPEAKAKGEKWFRRYNTQNHMRYVDENTEGTMLHTKAIVTKETKSWKQRLSSPHTAFTSLVGVEWPDDTNVNNVYGSNGQDDNNDDKMKVTVEIDGSKYHPNCYQVPWIRDHWSPMLNKALKDHVGYRL